MNSPKIITALICLLFVASGCSTGQRSFSKYPLDLSEVLSQVNDAILAAKALNKDEKVPEISSIELDLQIGTSSQLTGTLPISIVTTDGAVGKENTQFISLLFRPNGKISSEKLEEVKTSELTSAIGTIYKSVAKANPTYDFQQGRVTLQCTLKKGLDAKLGLTLIPIQIGASHSHELIQTITLNFGNNSKNNLQGSPKEDNIDSP